MKRAYPAATQVGLRQLFIGFLSVGLSGFGGVLPWARRMLVQERKWLSEREFVEILSLCQLLPGPNIVNVAVTVGNRFQGGLGALVAVLGLMLAPMVIVLALVAFYGRYVEQPIVHGLIRGISAAAAGLVVAMAVKIAAPYRHSGRALALMALTFVAVALLRLPLWWTMVTLAPISVALAWRRQA